MSTRTSGEPPGEPQSRGDGMPVPRRILIIDRDDAVGAAFRSLFGNTPLDLRHVPGVEAAVSLLDGWQPEMILLEGGDRVYIATAVGVLREVTSAPVPIVLTSQGAAGAVVSGLADYLPKPFSADTLRWILRRHVSADGEGTTGAGH